MDKKLSALIVDDEEKAVALLGSLLHDTMQFSSIRTARSPVQAVAELDGWEPDLIFLDVKMPGKDGVSFLKDLRLARTESEIVFVTAHDEYALEAIREFAFGYLLKPVDREELARCIDHYRRTRKRVNVTGGFPDGRIRFNTRTGYFFVEPSDILYCQADGNYCSIQTTSKQHLCSLQLGRVMELLPRGVFVRLGRSLIINPRFITSVDRKKKAVVLKQNAQEVSIQLSSGQLKLLEKMTIE